MDPDFDKREEDTICFDNDDYYEGEVVNRVPHGVGTMYYADGRTVTGKWIYGELVWGKRDDDIPPGGDPGRDRVTVGGHTLYVGYGYNNDTIADAFGINRYIRGIRIYHDTCVLLSLEESIYQDGNGWEPDSDGEPIFVYTGEGLQGDQTLTRGNLFLKSSTGGRVYLFVKRKPNEYIFHGEVIVKRMETAKEKDNSGSMRKVYKFILARA